MNDGCAQLDGNHKDSRGTRSKEGKTYLLDKVQLRLALTDQEFLDFLVLLSELSGIGPNLRNIRLTV